MEKAIGKGVRHPSLHYQRVLISFLVTDRTKGNFHRIQPYNANHTLQHPSLRLYRHHLTLLSAHLSLWQHNFKFARSVLRRLIASSLPSDPPALVYSAHLALISQLAVPTSSAPALDTPTKKPPQTKVQAIHASLDALTTLRALSTHNSHGEITLLADVVRLRVLVDNAMWGSVGGALGVCEEGLQAASSADSTLLTSLKLHTLILGVLFHTHTGDAKGAGERLTRLHALCDAGGLDDAGAGVVEVRFKERGPPLSVVMPHPRVILLLTYLGSYSLSPLTPFHTKLTDALTGSVCDVETRRCGPETEAEAVCR